MIDKKKKGKSFIINTLFVVFLGVLFFTPVGTSIKVWLNRALAMSPSLEKIEDFKSADLTGWTIVNEEGSQLDLDSLKDKVVIINFWATWCPPCIAEKPSFQELYDDYKNKVVFLFVTNEEAEKVAQFKAKHNYTLPIFFSMNAAPTALYSSSIPATFVLNKKGQIVVKKFRSADWSSSKFRVILDDLLEEK